MRQPYLYSPCLVTAHVLLDDAVFQCCHFLVIFYLLLICFSSCPAPLSPEKTKEAQELALKVHRLLGLGNYSRVDFILSDKDDKFYCLEANNLPGMTPNSLLPQEARAIGISYEDLCEKLVLSAM